MKCSNTANETSVSIWTILKATITKSSSQMYLDRCDGVVRATMHTSTRPYSARILHQCQPRRETTQLCKAKLKAAIAFKNYSLRRLFSRPQIRLPPLYKFDYDLMASFEPYYFLLSWGRRSTRCWPTDPIS